ncbi:MAG TPA: amino acid permease [Gemmatimonadales bacterium]|nr:amino acid permease [Gemmatimonadales bacterium]
MTSTRPPSPTADLKRELTLFDAIMLNAGTTIASAIFIVPATVAAGVHGSLLITAVWVIGGLVSLLGALSVAELAAMYPEAGGQYAYLREAYGKLPAFLYGWANFSVINTASIAAIAVGFARYVGFFTPLSETAIRVIAILSIIALTLLNCRGVRLGATTQNVLTVLKIGALFVIILTSFILPGGSVANLQPLAPATSFSQWIAPFGVAMVAVLWAYDGWIESTYVGSEVMDPQRNLPRSIILATLLVIAVYTLTSIAYMYVLAPSQMAGSEHVASDAAKVTMGSLGATFVVVAILISTLGANNGIILSAARIPFAMARQGAFFESQGRLHATYATPVVALLTQGLIASALTLVPQCVSIPGVFSICSPRPLYDQLATYVVFAQFVFYALSAGAVIRLRRRAPDAPRPYRTWGYPATPIVFIFFAVWLVLNTIVATPKDSAIGAGLILLGLPGYYYWRRAGAVRR